MELFGGDPLDLEDTKKKSHHKNRKKKYTKYPRGWLKKGSTPRPNSVAAPKQHPNWGRPKEVGTAYRGPTEDCEKSPPHNPSKRGSRMDAAI